MPIATRTPDEVRPTDPDADLVDALRRRDERALMTLVRRHSPTMLRVARGYVAPELAEDVVQETWIAVLRGIDGFIHRALFKTWLMRILVNAACSRRAKERRAVLRQGAGQERQQFALTGAHLGVGRRSTVVVGSRAR